MKRAINKIMQRLIVAAIAIAVFPSTYASAEEQELKIKGNYYQFDDDTSEYNFENKKPVNIDAYGVFSIIGDLKKQGKKGNVAAYEVNSIFVDFVYKYDDKLLNADSSNDWALAEDNAKKVNDVETGKVEKGALIVETSIDGENWEPSYIETNAFENYPTSDTAFYATDDVQLANGRYYRVYVAYELEKENGTKTLFVLKNHNYKKVIEVYTFYLKYNDELSTETTLFDDEPYKTLGTRAEYESKDSGYDDQIDIESGDPHIGWSIGEFRINGFTSDVTSEDGYPVFLKTVGDSVTLWFNLRQDIDELNGNPLLTINYQKNAEDIIYETGQIEFKHGALILTYEDDNNDIYGPYIYTDFLAANGSEGANTKIVLNEEGLYNVTLDYEIKDDRQKIGPVTRTKYYDYSVFTTFEVRNGNNQAFIFDVKTGSELMNNSITSNGFRIDLAKSKSVNVSVERLVLNNSTNILDSRFNKPVRDGDEFTDEGIYEITIQNPYTQATDTKQIYVGNNTILKAYVTTGNDIENIKDRLNNGWTINNDGTMNEPEDITTSEPITKGKDTKFAGNRTETND